MQGHLQYDICVAIQVILKKKSESDIERLDWNNSLVATSRGNERTSITFAVSSNDYWGWNWFGSIDGDAYKTELVWIRAESSDSR